MLPAYFILRSVTNFQEVFSLPASFQVLGQGLFESGGHGHRFAPGVVKSDHTRFGQGDQFAVPGRAVKKPETGSANFADVAIDPQRVKQKTLGLEVNHQVGYNQPGLAVAQVELTTAKKVQQVHPGFVDETHQGVIAQVTAIINVGHLDDERVLKFISRLFLKFYSGHLYVSE
jgi:hypothetical protein